MSKLTLVFFILIQTSVARGQSDIGSSFANDNYADSLLNQIRRSADDTAKVKLLNALGDYYTFIRQDSSIFYFGRGIELAERINFPAGGYEGYAKMAFVLNTGSNYGKALDMALRSLRIAEKLKANREENMARSYNAMGLVNRRMQNDTIARDQCLQSILLYKEAGITVDMPRMNFSPLFNLALIYLKWKIWDSAYYYAKNSYDISQRYPVRAQAQISVTATTLASVYEKTGRTDLAKQYYQHAIEVDKKYNVPLLRVRLFNNVARFFKSIGQLDSCIYFAESAFQLCQNHQFGEQTTDAASMVAAAYELLKKPDSALKYTKIFIAVKDTIFNQSKLVQIQLLNFDEGQRQKDIQREIAAAQERFTNKIRYFTLITVAFVFLMLSLILYRNNRNKKIANRILESQKIKIGQQRAKAEETLEELKSTQALLIQSEKMASLGELTAGIAHEIQNPLNFVNNFSEVNSELAEELKTEALKGNKEEVIAIANDIQANAEKISHHGKRADAIVKGMLLHSQSSKGKKEPTDINALADEYFHLSYHGLRAREKSFNAAMTTDYDQKIGNINIITQDFGRVLLNLYNNAFYAVSEKKKQLAEGYEPTVSVSTRKVNGKVEVRLRDNGSGIPQNVLDKIFQPFFTTKPTGQGTGLGLSISYDIVKAHGGEIKVDTKEGEFTEFVIQIPVV